MAVALTLLLAACGEHATLLVRQGSGPDPVLPSPVRSLLPTLHIAPASGWSSDGAPSAAPGLAVAAFARDMAFDHDLGLGRHH